VSERAARSYVGKLLSTNRLPARDLLPIAARALSGGTQDPRAYLAKACRNAAEARADPAAPPRRVGFV
jgi:hypothetical protein